MPAYNHEKFVGEAIEGVLNQSFTDYEFIIIDDGSTDKTADVIRSYNDPRIQYYYQENQDAYNALNAGLAKASGEFYAILNSDDVYTENRFERLFEIQQETGAQCLFTDVTPISDQSEDLLDPEFGWNHWHQKNRAKYFELNDVYAGFLHGNFMVTTSNLFLTADLAKKIGGFTDLRYLHDYDYIFRAMLAAPGQTHYVHDETLLKYRIHSGNTLSEAAIIGREQDQHVIRTYLLARFDAADTPLLETAIDRLISLENELIDVKAQLNEQLNEQLNKNNEFKATGKPTQQALPNLCPSLPCRIWRRIKRTFKQLGHK